MIGLIFRLADRLRQRARDRDVRRGRLAPHRALGQQGEDLAHRFLQREGLRIIARNWRTRNGGSEIDLIAWEGPPDAGTLVFVEVKTRRSDEFSAPERQVGGVKRQALIRGAAEYLRRFEPQAERVRFDVVSIVFTRPPRIRHERDAFHVAGLEYKAAADPKRSAIK
jgi:putative endonuclease